MASAEAMIRLILTPKHPVTVVATGEIRYHFARLVSASRKHLRVRLRKQVPRLDALKVNAMIIETFGQFARQRIGTVLIEIDCRNISTAQNRLLKLKPHNVRSLDVRIVRTVIKPAGD